MIGADSMRIWWLSKAAWASLWQETGEGRSFAQDFSSCLSRLSFSSQMKDGFPLIFWLRDQLVKAFLMDPKGAKSKGNGPQVFFRGKIKEDWLMVGDTIGDNFGGRKKSQREEGRVHQKPVKPGCNVPRP